MKEKIFQKIKNIMLTKVTHTVPFNLATLLLALLILFTFYNKGILAITFISGKPITVSEILSYYRQEQTGNELEKNIAGKILSYEAKKQNIIVNISEIKSEMDRIEKEAIDNGQTLSQLLKEREQTEKQLERDVKTNLIVYKLLSENVEVSEADIDEFLSKNPDLYKGYGKDEAKERVKKLLIFNKANTDYEKWILEAKAAMKY